MSFLGSIGASMGGDIFSAIMQSRENEKQRDWQEDMRATSHQVEVKDLEAAGLNSILSAGTGGGVPSGSNTAIPSIETSLNAGLQYEKIKQDIEESKARQSLNSAQEAKTKKETEAIGGRPESLINSAVKSTKSGAKSSWDSMKEIWGSVKQYMNTPKAKVPLNSIVGESNSAVDLDASIKKAFDAKKYKGEYYDNPDVWR